MSSHFNKCGEFVGYSAPESFLVLSLADIV